MLISPSDRIFIAGHRGMAGSAIVRRLQATGHDQLLTAGRSELDLLDGNAVAAWFADQRPDVVVLAAARVGGILANATYPADFLLDNLKIQQHVIESAWRQGSRRLLFLGSSCIYPKLAEQPIREEALLGGPLEPTNEWYAIAKITGIQLCRALRRQHGFDAISLMPTNLYGPGDNYHPTNSHVLPGQIRRFQEAREAAAPEVICWGSGRPRREFLHVDDLADAALFCLRHWQPGPEDLQHINVGTGTDVSIQELATMVADAVGYRGRIGWDSTKPDGTPRKLLDVSRLAALGWRATIPLQDGLRRTVAEYVADRASGAEVRL
ncbi:GDP-L-fucose synthase [Synechococcus sp. CCY 9618]|uniref:GDP-L-fucose synthase family protein n=1 Tax=Synechococcus sp. CCY 9618 TaxID=2815602 RepID=UPI001C233885|nr:GDP-L-fucose synthase [Synechococcus sp. CCY 9618]